MSSVTFNRSAGRVGNTFYYAWSYNTAYWREETLAAGDPNVSLEKIGGSWAHWRFTRTYPQSALTEGSDSEVLQAKIEVRAIAQDGKWGHGSYAFKPSYITSSSPVGR